MAEHLLIEWTSSQDDAPDAVADVTVFADGRLRLGPRFGGGAVTWHELTPDEVAALRRFLFDEPSFTEIETEALQAEVQAAAARRKRAEDDTTAVLSAVPQRDAGTTVLRTSEAGAAHEVRCYDLLGTAQGHPEIATLQRLRAIELRLLEIAQKHTT